MDAIIYQIGIIAITFFLIKLLPVISIATPVLFHPYLRKLNNHLDFHELNAFIFINSHP